ncbi:hypothetical protein JOM56_008445 [Amanita muscaria]|uniref:Imidazoleglycerol-phosphate dehydratase n=1 Tax=Amanita muscaria (strain Koide BX008) TaxID=946122 RepID=A0A0C2SXC1_AMAMK|nr:hypothetical protein M378DRAFT_185172 [Amanita muscaria Koide BX008]
MEARSRQRQDIEQAYQIQARAAVEGAARGAAIGLGLAILGHYLWPVFRRQTLAFKAFLTSGCTIAGLTFGAENALLAHEAVKRKEENLIRREARIDLARQGLVGTETEIAKWRAARGL